MKYANLSSNCKNDNLINKYFPALQNNFPYMIVFGYCCCCFDSVIVSQFLFVSLIFQNRADYLLLLSLLEEFKFKKIYDTLMSLPTLMYIYNKNYLVDISVSSLHYSSSLSLFLNISNLSSAFPPSSFSSNLVYRKYLDNH